MPIAPARSLPARPGFLIAALLLVVSEGCARVTEFSDRNVDPHHYGDMAFSPDSRTLAIPEADGRVKLCDLTTGKVEILPSPYGDQAEADHVVYTKQGRFLAVTYVFNKVTDKQSVVMIWDIPARKTHLQLPFATARMEFTEGDRILAGMTIETHNRPWPTDWNLVFIRWDVATGKDLSTVDFGKDLTLHTLSPDGLHAVLQDSSRPSVINLSTQKKLFDLPDWGEFLFSEDGSVLVSYIRGRLSLLEISSGKPLKHLGDHYPNDSNSHCLSLSRDQRLLAVGRFDGDHKAGIINLESGKILGTFECAPPDMMIKNIRISPDGRTVATNTGGTGDQLRHP